MTEQKYLGRLGFTKTAGNNMATVFTGALRGYALPAFRNLRNIWNSDPGTSYARPGNPKKEIFPNFSWDMWNSHVDTMSLPEKLKAFPQDMKNLWSGKPLTPTPPFTAPGVSVPKY